MSILEQYWRGVLQRLRADVDVLSNLIVHPGEKGRANEVAMAQILEAFLPARWEVGTGLLIDSRGNYSKQMDIVVHERSDQPAAFAQTTQMLFPVESVVACIEIKTTVTTTDLKKDLPNKQQSVLSLEPIDGHTHPLFAILGYNSGASPSAVITAFEQAQPRPDLACILSYCLLAGTEEALAGDEDHAGHCLLQTLDADGRFDGNYIKTDDSDPHMHDGIAFPAVRVTSGGPRLIGDPGRLLLLFVEALARAGSARRGDAEPIISGYLSETTRNLVTIS